MPKKLISVRLSEDLLAKAEGFKKNKNQERMAYHCKQERFSRKYTLSGSYYGTSVADVIELALLEFFEDKNL